MGLLLGITLSSVQIFSSAPSHLRFTQMVSFLKRYQYYQMERLHRAASRAITGCLSSSPIPILLSEASLLPLRVTLAYFTLLSYERALRLPTSFPISGLARLGVKPRLCRSSWRVSGSTHPLMLPSTSPREALLACSPQSSLEPPFIHGRFYRFLSMHPL